jgi:hypothetical protein
MRPAAAAGVGQGVGEIFLRLQRPALCAPAFGKSDAGFKSVVSAAGVRHVAGHVRVLGAVEWNKRILTAFMIAVWVPRERRRYDKILPSRTVFGGVEAFGAERVGQKCLRIRIKINPATVRAQRCGNRDFSAISASERGHRKPAPRLVVAGSAIAESAGQGLCNGGDKSAAYIKAVIPAACSAPTAERSGNL